MTKTDIKKKAMLEAMTKTLGIVSDACKNVGIARQTHYEWMRKDLDYATAIKDIENVTLDFAESKLHEQIRTGNVASIIFFLKTKGKVRGYIERQELNVSSETPDLSGLTTEELMDLVNKSDG